MSKKREEPLDPAVLGRLNEDHWKPRKKNAEGDRRHYLTTNKGTAPGLPQPDEYNPGVVWWFSKRIWLGHKPKARYLAGKTPPEQTRLWKLFDVLAYSPDRWHSVSEIHERVFGKGLGEALSTFDSVLEIEYDHPEFLFFNLGPDGFERILQADSRSDHYGELVGEVENILPAGSHLKTNALESFGLVPVCGQGCLALI